MVGKALPKTEFFDFFAAAVAGGSIFLHPRICHFQISSFDIWAAVALLDGAPTTPREPFFLQARARASRQTARGLVSRHFATAFAILGKLNLILFNILNCVAGSQTWLLGVSYYA